MYMYVRLVEGRVLSNVLLVLISAQVIGCLKCLTKCDFTKHCQMCGYTCDFKQYIHVKVHVQVHNCINLTLILYDVILIKVSSF